MAVALRWALDPLMHDALPLVTLFGAVAAAVWMGGYRAAVLVAVLGYMACAYLFIPPRGEFRVLFPDHTVGLAAYLFTCSIIVAFGEWARIAKARANQRGDLLRITLASIGDAIITTDIHGRVTYVNEVAESLTGWTKNEAAGVPLEAVFRVVNESTRESVENPAIRALREGNVVGLTNHSVLIRKDGSECPIDDSAAPIRDEQGRVSGCVLIFREITERRRLERESASQLFTARVLAAIVESSDDAIISKSLDGVIQSWNEAAERVFGHTAEQAIGRHISLVIPPERTAEEDQILASLKAGQRIDHFETERVRRDGRRILVSLTISPIKDDAGNVIGASKIVRDITDHKKAEAERERLVDSLQRMAADLSEADRRKTEFLAMLSHELRNPLAPISNAVQVLRLGSGDRDAIHAASEMLERQVRQMSRLVDDLLDISRITRGKIELRTEKIELATVIDQAVEAARALYKSMNHELTVALPSQPIYLIADPARLTQVMGNILNNACKFTENGGHIRLTVEQCGNEAIIRVRDSGVGIEAGALPHVFEMFTQVDTSLERSRDGLGIGLTLVQTLVEMHGGAVEAHSDGLGRGSEFVVRLPIAAEASESPSPAAIRDSSPTVRRRVLIVDDNVDGAQSLAMMLKLHGHETHVAHDGLEALDAAGRLRPDAVLLDIGLPKLSGYEACRHIREHAWGKNLLVVALTGWGQEEDRRKSREAGFDAHIVKPVDIDAIIKILARVPERDTGAQQPAPDGASRRS